jgi:Flp pilus assembly protein TadG
MRARESVRARERGAVSLVVVAGALVLCLTALCAGDFGALLLARARAQAAADAAALAAIVQQAPALATGETPEAAARSEAQANGARLVRCDCAPGTATAVVEVAVAPSMSYMQPWFGKTARATARADLDPDVLTYRAG